MTRHAHETNVQDRQIEDERPYQVESEDCKSKVNHKQDSAVVVDDRTTDEEKQMAKNESSGKDERVQKDWDD